MYSPPSSHPLVPLQELGASALSKRPTSCMLILPKPLKAAAGGDDDQKDFDESYQEVEKKLKAVVMPV